MCGAQHVAVHGFRPGKPHAQLVHAPHMVQPVRRARHLLFHNLFYAFEFFFHNANSITLRGLFLQGVAYWIHSLILWYNAAYTNCSLDAPLREGSSLF